MSGHVIECVFLSGLYLQAHFPDTLREVEEQEEAIGLAESAISYGVSTIRAAAGFDGAPQGAFDKFMREASERQPSRRAA